MRERPDTRGDAFAHPAFVVSRRAAIGGHEASVFGDDGASLDQSRDCIALVVLQKRVWLCLGNTKGRPAYRAFPVAVREYVAVALRLWHFRRNIANALINQVLCRF